MMQTKKHSKINKKVFIVCAIVVAIIAVLLTIAAFYDY
jgi:hypothetical protein